MSITEDRLQAADHLAFIAARYAVDGNDIDAAIKRYPEVASCAPPPYGNGRSFSEVPGGHILVPGPGGVDYFAASEQEAREVWHVLAKAYAHGFERALDPNVAKRVKPVGDAGNPAPDPSLASSPIEKLRCAIDYLRATQGKGLSMAYADTYVYVLNDAYIALDAIQKSAPAPVPIAALMEAVAEGMNCAEQEGEVPMSWIQTCLSRVKGVSRIPDCPADQSPPIASIGEAGQRSWGYRTG